MTPLERITEGLKQLNDQQLTIIEQLLASWQIDVDDETDEETSAAEKLMKDMSPIQPAKDNDMNDLERILGRKF
ncbi:MAG: hypothetical protein Q4A55_01380 [Aerococcus sp.]|nr:hypothetical protein [Aerococcus sp.]